MKSLNHFLNNTETNLGFYTVGNQIFDNKVPALVAATKHKEQPVWHFHNHVFDSLNWQTDYNLDLSAIYQQRAQQLREKYDWITLCFSGGSDSWTAWKAFYDSKTHLDEIYVRWPLQATSGNYQILNNNFHASNILSEWDLTIVPLLSEIQKLSPSTKITVYDWSTPLLTSELTDYDWNYFNDWLNPGYFLKMPSITDFQKNLIQKGKKIAVVFGVDKPQILYRDEKIYGYFLDKLASRNVLDSDQRTAELFYWTKDLPELVVAQTRTIFNWLKHNKNYLYLIDVNTINTPCNSSNKKLWDHLVKKLIYADYCKLGVFQADKGTTAIFDEIDDWMYRIQNQKFYQSWLFGLKNVLNSIDDKFIEKNTHGPTGFVGFIDHAYLVGTIGSYHNTVIKTQQ